MTTTTDALRAALDTLRASLLGHDALLDAFYAAQDAKRKSAIQLLSATADHDDAAAALKSAQKAEQEAGAMLNEARARMEATLRAGKVSDV